MINQGVASSGSESHASSASTSQEPTAPPQAPKCNTSPSPIQLTTSAAPGKGVNELILLKGAVQFFRALEDTFAQAKHYIALETYIFNFQAQGAQIAQALLEAAERGVQVYVLVDGVGTPDIPTAWLQQFNHAGVQWVQYLPLGSIGLLLPSRWRRLHRKLCVIDGRIAFCGGINILDDYYDPNHGALEFARWDFALQVKGPLVQTIDETMKVLWFRNMAKNLAQTKTVDGVKNAWQLMSLANEHLFLVPSKKDKKSLERLLLRDNIKNRRRIEQAYLLAFANAKHEILIANAYFLPGKKVRTALLKAVKRGVRVRVLLQGRYEYFMQYHASRAVYLDLLLGGVEIYEYQESFLHAKVAVADAGFKRSWCTVGSSNLDPLSLLLAREANIEVLNHPIALELADQINQAISSASEQVVLEQFQKRDWRLRMLNWLAYGLMRFALMVTGKRY